jgi:hypothetical protein
MRTFGIVALVIVLLIGGGVVWWKITYPSYSYRYRLTFAIEVDGKIHTGSSVIEITWHGGPELGDVGPYYPSIRGQAVLVDLGARGAVVAALVNGESYGPAADGALSAIWLASYAFGNKSTNKELPQLTQLAGNRHLSTDNMPRLIYFSDIANPKTAERILVSEIPKVLGQNARLVDATVEITRDPIVIDIDKKLPWYNSLRGPPNNVMYLPNGFALGWTMFVGDVS